MLPLPCGPHDLLIFKIGKAAGGEPAQVGDAIRAASPDATLTECPQAAFAAAEAAMTPQQRAKAAQRVLVVGANTELQRRWYRCARRPGRRGK